VWVEQSALLANSILPVLSYLDQDPRFHARIFLDDSGPQCNSKFDRLLCEHGKWYTNKVMSNSTLVMIRFAQQSPCSPEDVAKLSHRHVRVGLCATL